MVIYTGSYIFNSRTLPCLFPACLYLSIFPVNIKKAKVERRELYAIKNIINITRNIIYSMKLHDYSDTPYDTNTKIC